VSPEKDPVMPQKIEEAHKAGISVVPWTANTRAEWDALVAAKVDAIIGDDLAVLIAYLKEKGLR
jgi:glycerophosphoryl diester phosphodiesterase